MSDTTHTEGRTFTFGEQLMGVSFNPSQSPAVDNVKKAAAAFADAVKDNATNFPSGSFQADLVDRALHNALIAQMQIVKALTWNSTTPPAESTPDYSKIQLNKMNGGRWRVAYPEGVEYFDTEEDAQKFIDKLADDNESNEGKEA